MTTLRIERPGLLTTIQDAGRFGYERWGVSPAGTLDDYAASWANRLLGNPDGAAVLEMMLMGPEMVVVEAGAVAWAGAPFDARIDDRQWPAGRATRVEPKMRIRFGTRRQGMRAYLAVPGGFNVPVVLGSRATDLGAGIGGYQGRALKDLDVVRSTIHAFTCHSTSRVTSRVSRRIRVMPGMRINRFPATALPRLVTQPYRVSSDSNGMGVRLEGEPVAHPRGDWPSEGMPVGAVQCLPSGLPLILMKSRGTMGGYPVLAHVIRADWPALAQLGPGDEVSFEIVDRPEALRALSEQQHALSTRGGRIRLEAVCAPCGGLVRRRDSYGRLLPSSGEWVTAGQIVMVLESLGTYLPLTAPVDGVLADVAEEGRLRAAQERLFSIRAEED